MSTVPKEITEEYKKKLAQRRKTQWELEQVELQRMSATLLNEKNTMERAIEIEEDPKSLYEEWLAIYKQKKTDFNEDENYVSDNEQGGMLLNFKDPYAEEDFARFVAAKSPQGEIIDKGIMIATFEGGRLIDPRTKEEFPEGGYAHLVMQLDAGVAYEDAEFPNNNTFRRC